MGLCFLHFISLSLFVSLLLLCSFLFYIVPMSCFSNTKGKMSHFSSHLGTLQFPLAEAQLAEDKVDRPTGDDPTPPDTEGRTLEVVRTPSRSRMRQQDALSQTERVIATPPPPMPDTIFPGDFTCAMPCAQRIISIPKNEF